MTQREDDPIWNAAWDWVQREYDHERFDDVARAEMTSWLLAHTSHRRAYDKAARLWLLAGLVPPTYEFGTGDAAPKPGGDD
jgi:transmembrane sensor